MKSKIFSILLCFVISSCANKMTLPGDYDIQLVPEKGSVKNIDNIKVSYVIPNNILEPRGVDGLIFNNKTWGTDTKREIIKLDFNQTNMELERRTDNGVAGSGLIYSIDINKLNKGNDKVITFTPKTVKTYQDGVILPFPIPKFDLASYLTSAWVIHNFEVTSNYPVDSIKANFDRMLKPYGSTYQLQLPDCLATMEIKIYPYRQGSKAVITAEVSGMKVVDNIINVSNKIKELESKIKTIVND